VRSVSPLVPLPRQDSPLTAIAADLLESHTYLLTGTLYKQFKRSNPKEAERLEVYWFDASQYPSVVTPTGLALRAEYRAHHKATGG
jgi:hypothetical protein